ncbi:hypothetical protein ACRAWD_08695 [Caulobacter segnis]
MRGVAIEGDTQIVLVDTPGSSARVVAWTAPWCVRPGPARKRPRPPSIWSTCRLNWPAAPTRPRRASTARPRTSKTIDRGPEGGRPQGHPGPEQDRWDQARHPVGRGQGLLRHRRLHRRLHDQRLDRRRASRT